MARHSGVPEELTPEIVLPELSEEIKEVQRILTEKGFDIAQVVYVDKKKKEATYAVIETVRRPDYTGGTQMYYKNPDEDPLFEILERGRTQGKIAVSDWVRHVPAKSRFALSWDEIHNFVAPEVISTTPNLAEIVKKSGIALRVSTRAEFQEAGKTYSHFGEANSWEWLYDQAGFGSRLLGGRRDRGGLGAVDDWQSGDHHGSIGFRFQAVSPSQKLPQ